MIYVTTSTRDGKPVGAWVFDENQMGVFLSMTAVKQTLNILGKIQGLCTGYEETYEGLVFYYSDTYQIVLSDGSEFVVIEDSERHKFEADLKEVP